MPTLIFILAAYSLYALYVLWSRCRRKRFSRWESEPKSARLLLKGGVVALVCVVWFVGRFLPSPPNKTLHLAGVLGASESGLIMARSELTPEKLPVANAGPGDHPAYALLHPETPPMLMPEKPASAPSPPRKPKVRPAKTEVQKKAGSKPVLKEKPPGKSLTKKKKPKSAIKPNLERHAYSHVQR